MTAVWEGKKFGFNFVTQGAENLTLPATYQFKLNKTRVTEGEFYYSVAAEPGTGSNPFSDTVLLPQQGECLLHYLRPSERLDPGSSAADQAIYKKKLADLMDEIIKTKIEPDPDKFERLVGYMKVDGTPVNKVTFYKVENTHTQGKLLLVVQLQLDGSSPGGSIGVIAK